MDVYDTNKKHAEEVKALRERIAELEVYEQAAKNSYVTNCIIRVPMNFTDGDYLFNVSTGEFHLNEMAIIPQKEYWELTAQLKDAERLLNHIAAMISGDHPNCGSCEWCNWLEMFNAYFDRKDGRE